MPKDENYEENATSLTYVKFMQLIQSPTQVILLPILNSQFCECQMCRTGSHPILCMMCSLPRQLTMTLKASLGCQSSQRQGRKVVGKRRKVACYMTIIFTSSYEEGGCVFCIEMAAPFSCHYLLHYFMSIIVKYHVFAMFYSDLG